MQKPFTQMKLKDAKKEFARQRAHAIVSKTDDSLRPQQKQSGGKRFSTQGLTFALQEALLKRSPSQDSVLMGEEKKLTPVPSSSSSTSAS